MKVIDQFLSTLPHEAKILDVGCGEGVLVSKYHEKGHTIEGIDLNYSSEYVKRGNITNLFHENCQFDVVLCLDVIEHLHFHEQERAISEIYWVLREGGLAVFTIPNLAHLRSRVNFLLKGKLVRTADIDKHPGDRPIDEYITLLQKHDFHIERNKGIYLTLPDRGILEKILPSRFMNWLLNQLTFFPDLCFLNVLFARK